MDFVSGSPRSVNGFCRPLSAPMMTVIPPVGLTLLHFTVRICRATWTRSRLSAFHELPLLDYSPAVLGAASLMLCHRPRPAVDGKRNPLPVLLISGRGFLLLCKVYNVVIQNGT